MKKTFFLCLTVLAAVLFTFSACSGDGHHDVENPEYTLLNITVDENGVASWDAIPDAVEYEYNLVCDGTSYHYATTEDTQIQLYGGYCLHIRAVFADGSFGEWSISDTYGDPAYREELPSDIGPSDGTERPVETLINVTFDENGIASWDAIPDAVGYEYNLVYDGASYYNAITENTKIQLYEGYGLHIRAVFADGSFGEWSIYDTYGDPANREELPTDTDPSDGTGQPADTVINVTVDEKGVASWDAVPGAVKYEYVFLNDNVCYYESTTTETKVQLYEGYQVDVRAVFADGSVGYWMSSDIYGDPANRVDIGTDDPPSSDTNGIVTLDGKGVASWNAVPGAVKYEYTFVNSYVVYYNSTTTETKIQLYEGYHVDVRAVFADGSVGDWISSDIYGDPNNREDLSYLTDPSIRNVKLDLTINKNGTVSWAGISDAERYEYYYDDGSGSAAYLGSTQNTALALFEGYSLYVQACFNDGTFSQWARTGMYGDPANRKTIISGEYTTVKEDLTEFELISSIKYDTVKKKSDGSVYFEAIAPNGDTLHFVGEHLTVSKGKITFNSQSSLVCLDSVGRIYSYKASSPTEDKLSDISINVAYTFSPEKAHVDSVSELATMKSAALYASDVSIIDFQPNFIVLKSSSYMEGSCDLTELTVLYDDSSYCTPLRDLILYTDFYTAYLAGEKYDQRREVFDLDKMNFEFYLIAVPELSDAVVQASTEELAEDSTRSIYGINDTAFKVGDLKDKNGKTVNKQTYSLKGGETIEIIFGNTVFDVEIPVTTVYKDAKNMHALVPYAYPEATGTLNTLVIPIVWQDEPEDASDKMLALYRSELGRVMDKAGKVTDYSDGMTDKTRFSLSEYYDIASYGKLTVQSFITDWYYAPLNFADVKTTAPNTDFTDGVLEWLYQTYPDMDWSKFDRDANGYFDAVVFINSGDLGNGNYAIISFSGGIMTRNTYTAEFAGTPDRPTFNCYTNINTHLLKDNVLIHEYAHNLGLADYYDVNYSGINAVGGYDMQSNNYGDWNPYSKYSVGWIEPEVVRGLKSGESVDITIGALATTGNAIVIPGASSDYYGTPFSEYIMIDLFTDQGVNLYDAEKFGLKDAVGVRIYHVNSLMEYRELEVEGDKKLYPIGTIHTDNTYDITGDGKYLIELIQADGNNTFTDLSNLRTKLKASDLFDEGDVFDVSKYTEFFKNGLMDDGTEFGYVIKIVEITGGEEPTAVIRITKK